MKRFRRSAPILGLALSTFVTVGVIVSSAPDVGASGQLAPTVTGVVPSSGPLSGGTSVIITGSNYHSPATVSFGGVAAIQAVVQNTSTIVARSPAESAGSVDVTVTTTGGTSATSAADVYTYVAPPTVTSVSPSDGPSSGGTQVTITGTNFVGSTKVVFFGGVKASHVVRLNPTTITAISPAGSGTVDVTVKTRGGTSATSSADLFTYDAGTAAHRVAGAVVHPPTVTGLRPNIGALGGGTTVIVSGNNYVAPATVSFGGVAATNVVVQDVNHIVATSPAGSGTVDVTVTTPNGTSATSAADQFHYAPAPTVSSVSPNQGVQFGGTAVTITGTNFGGPSTKVVFGSAFATQVVRVNSTTITANSPAGSGTVDVTVLTLGGTSATSSADQFTYLAAPVYTGISPNTGPLSGGTAVTITGSNFVSPATVTFNGVQATNVVVVDSNTITADTPPQPAGTRQTNVRVTTAGGTSQLGPQFTYQPG
jgi:hypothetical protein